MSPTRKPRPPDKGAPPEHKPSRKVALDEVMRSLQDLVKNELATDRAQQPPTSVASPKPRATAKKPAVSTPSPQATEAASAETILETESITLVGLPDHGVTPPPALEPKPRAGTKLTAPAGGLQQELPYLDALPMAPDANQSETAMEAITSTEPSTVERETGNSLLDVPPTEKAAAPDVAPQSVTEAAPVATGETNWDDIPVLEEAVDMSEELEVNETGHAGDAPVATNLPPAEAARRLAIQVAARLNVELRKSGQGGLNSDIITRLARLLQEALAKVASNMENNPPDKH